MRAAAVLKHAEQGGTSQVVTISSDADEKLLRALAVAIVQHPRATLQELARAAGVSKATLYRFCRTRKQLIDTLRNYCIEMVGNVIEASALDTAPPLEALHRLTENHLAQKEFSVFLIYHWKPNEAPGENADSAWDKSKRYEQMLDAFFLRGQKEGVFRIDVSAACLADTYSYLLYGLMESERLGRVARMGLSSTLEQLFLFGVHA